MAFFYSTLHPETNPDLARARAQIIATSILIIDAAVNTVALLFFSSRPCSSSRDSVLAFAIARSLYLTLFLGTWLYLRLRILWIGRRAVSRPAAVRQWICELPGALEMLRKECRAPGALADCPAGGDELASSRDSTAAQVHALDGRGCPEQSGRSSLGGRAPRCTDLHEVGGFPFQDMEGPDNEELGDGYTEGLRGTGILKDPSQDHDTELEEGEEKEKEEEVHYRPGADRYVQYSIADVQHDEGARSAVIEQARRHPARHLAASRDLLYHRTRR